MKSRIIFDFLCSENMHVIKRKFFMLKNKLFNVTNLIIQFIHCKYKLIIQIGANS